MLKTVLCSNKVERHSRYINHVNTVLITSLLLLHTDESFASPLEF